MNDYLSTEMPVDVVAIVGLRPAIHGRPPGSVESLLTAIERHALNEQAALDQYRSIAATSGDPVIALVMRLILEDEQRHHELLKRIESTLRDALEWTHSPDALPDGVRVAPSANTQLAEAVQFLIDEEHTGARHMRDLARQRPPSGEGLDSMLLEMMAMDSDKHAQLLQFVHERLLAR